jgi:hypothetical protein
MNQDAFLDALTAFSMIRISARDVCSRVSHATEQLTIV